MTLKSLASLGIHGTTRRLTTWVFATIIVPTVGFVSAGAAVVLGCLALLAWAVLIREG